MFPRSKKTTGTCLASGPKCVFLPQVGDSIVHKARETLERAIKMVNDTKKWGARVVYGDTDRLVSQNATLFFLFTSHAHLWHRSVLRSTFYLPKQLSQLGERELGELR